MIPQRYDACYEDITPHDRGDYVKLEDVITMLENTQHHAQHIDNESDIAYEIGWDAGLEQLIQELKKELK